MSPPDAPRRRGSPTTGATVVVAGAGHWVQQEKPAEVNAALLDFLAGIDGLRG